ncbi:MAG: site-2 protease family protein [bacterium]|nr:site-2 protease family protein [bacterium]
MSIIIFLIILSALIIVHELGHFGVAKYFGIRVDEFGLGYPPRAKKLFSWLGTDFTLNWLPFGGFVKIFGENPTDLETGFPSDSFQYKNRGIQAAVLVAGVVCNFLFAWLIIASGFTAGLPTSNVFELTAMTAHGLGAFLLDAIVGQADLSNVIGPVGLVVLVDDVSKLGLQYLLSFTALISLNLSVINLLPLPALDGGRLLFVIIESITRRPIPAKFFNALNATGFALLILLMILVTVHDVRNIL